MRMIDADKLAEAICANELVGIGRSEDYWKTAWGIPIVDAEKVVRCKDCRFNYANQIPSYDVCQLCVELPITKEFYCAYGEKTE